ncbi:major facilitator superfamily transport protein [Natronomonas pharaonis DSM 2160]|uniref:Major facilitator superfamily transport protein n=1 Tax=Natronomonas pharaonis (strain ATCC 35678 / DSM 2160 / CIP 103997 / JCM 8858 / NBRC 14720 / NCIMB 2260 / Gabara) TaxID=348780 RepID=A0A1U7EXG9_NATPD|nr:MFS transporter [Natronomonas pharaonis]CAI49871.1 major facilitator superfamily transport protein [Natronomonas pharaonis DSM 2160]
MIADTVSVLERPTRYRWIAWGMLALAFLLASVHRLSTAVLSEALTAEFGLTAAQLGTLHASFFIGYALVQIPAGVLVDAVGPRHVGTAGAAAVSVGAIGFVFSSTYPTALLARAVIGVGGGVIFVSTLRFASNWFRVNEFASVTGLTAGMAGFGSILATTPLAVVIGLAGWRSTFLWFAVFGLLVAAAVYVLVRRSPAELGFDTIRSVPSQPSVTVSETGQHLRALARDPEQWLLSLCFFATMGSILTLLGLWGVPYLVTVYGLDVTTASYYTLLGAIGMLIGGPAVGRVSDRLGRRYLPMVVGFGLFVLVLVPIPLLGRPPKAVIAGSYFFTGFFIGAAVLTLSVIKEQYPAGASGVATAAVVTAGFLGGTVLPALLGVALDTYRTGAFVGGTAVYTEFGYRVAFALLSGAVAVAFLCSLWLFLRRGDEPMHSARAADSE